MGANYNTIFTFLNFKDFIPPYINLCLKTWKNYLQNKYQIIILTPENINDYIDKNFYNEKILNQFDMHSSIFCDYLSFLVLYSNGGIFMDADTIITDNFNTDLNLLKNYETVFFSQNNKIIPGFVMSRKHSMLFQKIITGYEQIHDLFLKKNKRITCINSIAKESLFNEVLLIDNMISAYQLETQQSDTASYAGYKDYYFTSKYSVEDFLKRNKGITALKNSNTPVSYKKMSESEFLKQDILLSKIFKVLL